MMEKTPPAVVNVNTSGMIYSFFMSELADMSTCWN